MRGVGLHTPGFRDDSDYYQAVLKDAPVLYWPLRSTRDFATDRSANALNGTVTGTKAGVPDPHRQFGMAQFGGTSADQITVSDGGTSPLDLTNSGTLECWCVPNFAGSGDGAGLILKQSAYFLRVRTAGTIQGYFYPTANISTSPTLTANRLYHVAVTYNKVNQKLYINGALVDTQSDTSAITNNNQQLVVSPDASAAATGYYKGLIAHVAVYSTALTAEQIRSHYQAMR